MAFSRWFDNKYGRDLYEHLEQESLKIGKIDYQAKFDELSNLYAITQ
jgi:hypothetical protein